MYRLGSDSILSSRLTNLIAHFDDLEKKFHKQICEHGLRSHCKDCGGSQICEHGRERNRCKNCGGSQSLAGEFRKFSRDLREVAIAFDENAKTSEFSAYPAVEVGS